MSINALGYAGMMLVKSEEEAEAVEKDTVVEILRYLLLCTPRPSEWGLLR